MNLRAIVVALLAVWMAFGASPASADWLTRLIAIGEKSGATAAGKDGSALANAARHIKSLPPGIKSPALAAHASQEGHWTFANTAGERFTAGTPDELKRVVSILAPEASLPSGGKVAFVLTEDTVFRQRERLADLPKGAELLIAFDDEAYPLLRRGAGREERLLAEVRPNLLIEIGERRMFDEAAWQLARSLKRSGIRVLALEPNGPQTLSPAPKLDPQTKRAMSDAIDPARIAEALTSIRGQTAVLTGRIEGGQILYRTPTGTERGIALKDLIAAAEASDVNLVVLQSSTPRQPGARNWLWQRVSVGGLDSAVERAHLADFLNALGISGSRLLVTAVDAGPGRIVLRAMPLDGERSMMPGISGVLDEVVTETVGKVATSGVEAYMKSSDRQRELDQRLISGLPSGAQYIYIACLALGLLGWSTASAWFARLWPIERPDGYAGGRGYLAARAVRLAAFTVLFLPIAGIVAGPLALLQTVLWPFRRTARA